MKRLFAFLLAITMLGLFSFQSNMSEDKYHECYNNGINSFNDQQLILLNAISEANLSSDTGLYEIKKQIESSRLKLKAIDFWLRYLEPIAYKRINGPLPVEWETEVFEKWEKPYKRMGAGLTLTETYFEEEEVDKNEVLRLIQSSLDATKTFLADSITHHLNTQDHFFFANRLYLLNLAAIYTTGFECPNTENVISELRHMLIEVKGIYQYFNQSFPNTPLTDNYLEFYNQTIEFVHTQSSDFKKFDHFTFIKDFVNPLYSINQELINIYAVISRNFNDYSLSNDCRSIFDKSLSSMQNTKGIFSLVENENTLNEIRRIGKLLFYDPILSGNNSRSCASCHKPKHFFTDTIIKTAPQFDKQQFLARNTPSLINAIYNHLLMMDGRHITLQAQAKDVITNPLELASEENELLEKILSCKDYKKAFKLFVKLTPEESNVTMDHVVSAITLYFSDFSSYYAPFDNAMNHNEALDDKSKKGFNIFMSKAQCATCHFVPFFNGVKPPYVGSEFEVLGVPKDTNFTHLSPDKGRYDFHAVPEMFQAFRTGTIRNIQQTKPYMHNGIFNTLDEVIEFYDVGGGQGKNLDVANQTLSPDSLKLTPDDKEALISFMSALNEKINFDEPPDALPVSSNEALNSRVIAGEY